MRRTARQFSTTFARLNLAKYMPEPGDTSGDRVSDRPRLRRRSNTATAKRPMMDSSKPLTILSHVGGSPLLLIASRSKQNIEDYERGRGVAEARSPATSKKIAEKKAEPDDWAKYQEFRDRGIALLERLDKANREHLYPALADGQGAFVMDVAAKSKQWFNKMPESPKPLPMLEMAFVASVSDAEKLRQGVTAYIDVARDAYKLVKEINPDDDARSRSCRRPNDQRSGRRRKAVHLSAARRSGASIRRWPSMPG